ncbi:MAG: transposase [Methanocalculaceae archaeon]|nr:transposase [Methanocalculaceae archaeon]
MEKPQRIRTRKENAAGNTAKTPVVGFKERSSGKVRAVVAKKDGQNKTMTGRQLIGISQQACKAKTTVISDEFTGYRILDNHKSEFGYVNGKSLYRSIQRS